VKEALPSMRQCPLWKNLEHRIVVGCFFRDILDDIPVFDDFAVFDAENVDSSLTTVCFIEFDVIVDEDQVAIGADVLDDGRAVRIGFKKSVTPSLKACLPSANSGLCCLYLGPTIVSMTAVSCLLNTSFQKYSAAALLLLKWGVSAASDVPMGRQLTRARVRPKRIDFLFM
jgi:hypothetical protein